jgi:hypothetical protein
MLAAVIECHATKILAVIDPSANLLSISLPEQECLTQLRSTPLDYYAETVHYRGALELPGR